MTTTTLAIAWSDIRKVIRPDEDPDTSYLDQEEFEEHKASYRRGDFSFVGVWAEVEIYVSGVRQVLRSGGLWGIEDDGSKASADYIESVFLDERDTLIDILKNLGIIVERD